MDAAGSKNAADDKEEKRRDRKLEPVENTGVVPLPAAQDAPSLGLKLDHAATADRMTSEARSWRTRLVPPYLLNSALSCAVESCEEMLASGGSDLSQ